MARKPYIWSDEKFERAQNHFNTFNLNKLYSSLASAEFISYKVMLNRLYKRGGENLIKIDLGDRIESKNTVWINSPEAAMYIALLNNEWFFERYLPSEIL